MKDLKWTSAIIKVLQEEQRPMHYTEIAQLVSERGYRKSLGATPQDTVSAQVSIDISRNGNSSTFIRIDKGIYALRDEFLNVVESEFINDQSTKEIVERTSAINAFGIYWNRDLVHWKSSPNLLGIQQQGASEVNFKSQIGIYLLHDARETIYVGQAIAQTLGERLKQHTTDRLSGRWDRFSWFGFHPVKEDGELQTTKDSIELTLAEVGNLLEAILIESIEPRQNRKQGNQFYGIEYLQKEDEVIAKKKLEQNFRDLLSK